MSADAVVKHFDVLENTCLGVLPAGVLLVVDPFLLQGGEEARHGRVVPALRHPAPAARDPVFAQQALGMLAGVRTAPVPAGSYRRNYKRRLDNSIYRPLIDELLSLEAEE